MPSGYSDLEDRRATASARRARVDRANRGRKALRMLQPIADRRRLRVVLAVTVAYFVAELVAVSTPTASR